MKPCLAWLFVLISATIAAAQIQLDHPEQFYTNGERVNAWSMNADAKLQSTLWFVKNPVDSLSYRQMVAIIYDAEPGYIYYYDGVEKKFVGRFEIESQQYSLLRPESQKQFRRDIDESEFPHGGDMPTISDMFAPLLEGENSNSDTMMMPPPVKEFPKLKDSTWDSSYTTANGRRIRAKLKLNGDNGSYEPEGGNDTGQLSNIHYDQDQDGFQIRGQWQLGESTGHFRLRIPLDNVDIFFGEWGFGDSGTNGIWDGARK